MSQSLRPLILNVTISFYPSLSLSLSMSSPLEEKTRDPVAVKWCTISLKNTDHEEGRRKRKNGRLRKNTRNAVLRINHKKQGQQGQVFQAFPVH